MNDSLFFELLRVAIGNADGLSHVPTETEWKQLYDIAKKQSLIGICFVALQRLCADANFLGSALGLNEMQYLTWMGMAAKIQHRNELMDKRCEELQSNIKNEGFLSCILKGQGVAVYYEDLATFRQSGDIDIWLDGNQKEIMQWISSKTPTNEVSFLHASLKVFPDIEVEAHFHPAGFRNLHKNKRVWRWYDAHKDEQMKHKVTLSSGANIYAPTPEFNIVFLLNHAYSHLLSEGIGLRQFLDIYMVLRKVTNEDGIKEARKMIRKLGMERFAMASMWVLKTVFVGNLSADLEHAKNEKWMLWEPDEIEGRFLLNEIMTGGNFGHYSKDYHSNDEDTPLYRLFMGMKRDMRFLRSYTSDVIAIPFWRLWHYCWRKRHGYK